ncbi:MAG: TetR/AcrR family transcriptional regulator [Pseudomonadota bacterium]
MNDATPIIRKGRKFDQVLDGARQVFMEGGFERASVDEIARVAGVSKATLYSYFPDKRLLFVEVLRSVCHGQTQSVLEQIDDDAPPREVLGIAGRSFLRFITMGPGLQIFRICVAEAAEFPELGRALFESGPQVMRAEMAEYFACAEERGELRIDDYTLAADQFGEMCKADIWMQMIMGMKTEVTEAEIARVIDGAVETFMARYGT